LGFSALIETVYGVATRELLLESVVIVAVRVVVPVYVRARQFDVLLVLYSYPVIAGPPFNPEGVQVMAIVLSAGRVCEPRTGAPGGTKGVTADAVTGVLGPVWFTATIRMV